MDRDSWVTVKILRMPAISHWIFHCDLDIMQADEFNYHFTYDTLIVSNTYHVHLLSHVDYTFQSNRQCLVCVKHF